VRSVNKLRTVHAKANPRPASQWHIETADRADAAVTKIEPIRD
jgi:hypothetical protein